MYVGEGCCGGIEKVVDSTTIDSEHARLVREGWRFLTNGEQKNESNYIDRSQKTGLRVHVCRTAYAVHGGLLEGYFSFWGKEVTEN